MVDGHRWIPPPDIGHVTARLTSKSPMDTAAPATSAGHVTSSPGVSDPERGHWVPKVRRDVNTQLSGRDIASAGRM